jgi:3-deoxy-D-manno-octulosonic-acid transferase
MLGAPSLRFGPSWVLRYASLLLYQLAYILVFCCFLVWRMVFASRYRSGIGQRLGLVPRTTGDKPVVWIHGVSVGEVKAAGSLIEQLGATYPDLELVISSTTPTGYRLAGELHPDLRVIYYPLDLGPCPGMALRRIKPTCVLLMELEVWPVFLHAAARQNIPVAVINGRISEQSFGGYRLARTFLPQFNLIQIFCMQDEVYRSRLLDLNVDAASAVVTGNMKYDNAHLGVVSVDPGLRAWLSPDDRPVIVCGSTHGDEESWLAQDIAAVASDSDISLRTVLVPRHPERAVGVCNKLTANGVVCRMWSQDLDLSKPLEGAEVVIVDTIGHLEKFYAACDLAFVGGSLIPRGGQNMVEAAAMGKPGLFGPHVSNFRKDVALLLGADAACQVQDRAELRIRMAELLANAELRDGLGERAVALIQRNQGSTGRTLAKLAPLLERAAK